MASAEQPRAHACLTLFGSGLADIPRPVRCEGTWFQNTIGRTVRLRHFPWPLDSAEELALLCDQRDSARLSAQTTAARLTKVLRHDMAHGVWESLEGKSFEYLF